MQATLSIIGASVSNKQPAALRLSAPADETRVPVHFIALIDVSESMNDNSKLKHVKHCLSLLVNFLTPADEVSLITFGDRATVVLKRAAGTAANASTIRGAIAGLRTDGCTNLSAGLAAVSTVLDAPAAGDTPAASPLKPVLLILTDGHANRGNTSVAQLRGITSALERRACDAQQGLAFSFVAYGTDHNAALLQELAAQHTTSYSIVHDLESAALTMGESLGGATGCCAQNVVARCPAGTVAHGAYAADTSGSIRIGDLYAGAEICVLLDLPVEAAAMEGGPVTPSARESAERPGIAEPVTVEGIILPSLEPLRVEATREVVAQPPPEIQLARLQIRCSALFQRIREEGASAAARDEFEALRAALQLSSFDGHPIAEMLRQELPSLEAVLNAPLTTAAMTTQLAAHQQYVLLGRGTSQPIELTPTVPVPYVDAWIMGTRGGDSATDSEEEEPVNESFGGPLGPVTSNPRASVPRQRSSYLSPVASNRARRVAEAMQELSQQQP